MLTEREERLYEITLRMVLWDEPKEAVYQKLEVNGITGDQAKEFYQLARRDRLATLRAGSKKRGLIGMYWIVGGVAPILFFFYFSDAITLWLLLIFGGMALFGLCTVGTATFDYLLAATKTGSVTDYN